MVLSHQVYVLGITVWRLSPPLAIYLGVLCMSTTVRRGDSAEFLRIAAGHQIKQSQVM